MDKPGSASLAGRLRAMTGGRAIRDALSLLGGTAGARIIQILAIPVIARLFDPADYGRVSVLVALAATLTQGSSLGYEGAIVLPATGSRPGSTTFPPGGCCSPPWSPSWA